MDMKTGVGGPMHAKPYVAKTELLRNLVQRLIRPQVHRTVGERRRRESAAGSVFLPKIANSLPSCTQVASPVSVRKRTRPFASIGKQRSCLQAVPSSDVRRCWRPRRKRCRCRNQSTTHQPLAAVRECSGAAGDSPNDVRIGDVAGAAKFHGHEFGIVIVVNLIYCKDFSFAM